MAGSVVRSAVEHVAGLDRRAEQLQRRLGPCDVQAAAEVSHAFEGRCQDRPTDAVVEQPPVPAAVTVGDVLPYQVRAAWRVGCRLASAMILAASAALIRLICLTRPASRPRIARAARSGSAGSGLLVPSSYSVTARAAIQPRWRPVR